MNGREWGWHSRPPMILPSQRGTAATARAHKTNSKRRKWHAALWGVDPSVTEWAFVCMCICLYRQLQASAAAEPAVSWCRMSDQKTPGHTQAWLYMPAPPPRPFSTLFFLGCFFCSCWPHLCHSTVFPLGTNLQPRSNLLSGCFFLRVCPLPLRMSSVPLIS